MISHIKYIFIIILSVVVLVTSCDDEPFPTDFEGEVVFIADGTLDNNTLILEAGKEDFYMYTDVELEDDMLRFSGAFQKNDLCETPCDEKLKIIINNYKLGTDFEIDSALYIGNYSLEPSITIGSSEYQVDFIAIPEGGSNPLTYDWVLDNTGTVSTAQNPTNTYPDLDDVDVILTTTNSNGCSAQYTDKLSVSPTNNCVLDFTYTYVLDSFQNGIYTFNIPQIAHPDSAYNWEIFNSNQPFPDTFPSTAGPITYIDTVIGGLVSLNVCLTQNTPDCNTTICKTINQNDFCGVTFSYVPNFLVTPGDTSVFSMVIIEYTTPDGVFYSSELGSQAGSTFEILAIADYLQNERDQSTKSIEAAVDCKLYNAMGEFLDFTTNELIFSVSVLE